MPLESLQNGRYLSIRQLGRGSMGEVYLVDDTVIGRKVAIKLMLADPTGYPDTESIKDAVKLFKREAQAIARLEHPNILPLYDFGEEKQDKTVFTYMVMPYCQEGSLTDWLQQHYPQGPVSFDEAAYFIEQAAEALHYSHTHGVIHQDVKPSNFLLRAHAQGQRLPDLLLADFGIARVSTGTTVNTTHFGPRGTPRYMPPEQWEGKPLPASDQYALAIMAYQLFTHSFPFQGEQMHQVMYQHCFVAPEPPSKRNPHISPALDATILRALAKKPEDRFPTIQAFATAFRQALQTPAGSNFSTQENIEGQTGEAFNTSGPTLPLPNPNGPGPSSSQETSRSPLSASIQHSSAKAGQPASTPMIIPAYALPPNPEAYTIADRPVPQPLRQPAPVVPPALTPHFQQPVAYAPSVPASTAPPYTAPQPAMQQRRQASGGKIALFICLSLLVILGGSGLAYYLIKTNHNPDLNAYTSSMPTLRYFDPLSAAGHWKNNPNDGATNGYCLFQQNAYHASSNIALTYTLCPTGLQQTYSDMTFEVQMQILHGDCGGVAFRGNYQSAGTFYYFDVCSDGRHYLATYAHFALIQQLKTQSTPFPALQSSPQTTVTIAIVMQGSSLTFYLNHQQIDQVTDTTYTSGQITFFCYEVKDPTDVAFSNARLWTA